MSLSEIITEHVISMLEIPDRVTEGRPSESPTDKKRGVAIKGRFTTTRAPWRGSGSTTVCIYNGFAACDSCIVSSLERFLTLSIY